MKRMVSMVVLALSMAACGVGAENGSDSSAASQDGLGILPPVVDCNARQTEQDCALVSVACVWRPLPCPLGPTSIDGTGPVCIPFGCRAKVTDPGPISGGGGVVGGVSPGSPPRSP